MSGAHNWQYNMYTDGVTACDHAGNTYFSVIFFSLISLMFDGFAEETLTVCPSLLPDTDFKASEKCLLTYNSGAYNDLP